MLEMFGFLSVHPEMDFSLPLTFPECKVADQLVLYWMAGTGIFRPHVLVTSQTLNIWSGDKSSIARSWEDFYILWLFTPLSLMWMAPDCIGEAQGLGWTRGSSLNSWAGNNYNNSVLSSLHFNLIWYSQKSYEVDSINIIRRPQLSQRLDPDNVQG